MVAHLAWDSRWPGWVWLQGWHQLVEVEPAKPPAHLETPPVECQKLVCQSKFASPSHSGGMFRPSFKSLGRCTNTCPLPFLSKFCVVGATTLQVNQFTRFLSVMLNSLMAWQNSLMAWQMFNLAGILLVATCEALFMQSNDDWTCFLASKTWLIDKEHFQVPPSLKSF